jgi:hypothetical protein
MSTLTIISILAPSITFLIGRYFRSEKIKELKSFKNDLEQLNIKHNYLWYKKEALHGKYQLAIKQLAERENVATQALMELDTLKRNTPTLQIVPNINPHHSADKEYVGVYPGQYSILEPAHLTREEYQKGIDRLKDNPEDNILTKPVK